MTSKKRKQAQIDIGSAQYFHQTWDLIISRPVDFDSFEIIKRLNYQTEEEAYKVCDFLNRIFYGIRHYAGIYFEVETGPLLNMNAIRANRQAMMNAQLIDLPQEEI